MKKNYLKESNNVNLAYYIEAADKLGIDYEVIKKCYLVKFSYKGKHWYFMNAEPPINGKTACNISMNKNMSTRLLEEAGLPVANQKVMENSDQALLFWKENTNIVLKPRKGIGGKGVNLLPQTKEEVIQAFNDAEDKDKSKAKTNVLAEEFIQGRNYRLLVCGEKVIGAVYRKAPSITGNGKLTARELIEEKNAQRKEELLSKIPIDNQAELCLEAAGYSLDSVIPSGEELLIRYNSNLSTGGTTEECMSEVDPFYLDIAVKAAEVLDLRLAGVDLIAEDISDPTARCVVNELNYCPGLRVHYKVEKGETVSVADEIMEYTRDFYMKI